MNIIRVYNNMLINYQAVIFLLFTISTNLSAETIPNFAEKIKKLDASFVHLCQSNKFSGAALIAINGTVRFEKACGLASRDFHVQNTIKTKFNLGSVGKLFTSISIAQLIATNKLELSSTVDKFIPSWLNMPNGKAITINQLLIHTSGLSNFMDDKRWQLGADSGLYIHTDDYKSLVANKDLLFKPGMSQIYSNSGYLVLGAVIEKLSHKSYTEYITTHIFDVAKMLDTGIYPLDAIVKNRAVGYYLSCKSKMKECQWRNNYFEAPFIGTAAGGAYSTVGDLFKFSQSLFRNELFGPQMRIQVFSTMITQPSHAINIKSLNIGGIDIPENFSSYGFAGAWNKFGIAVWNNPSLIGHTGGTPGAAALFAMSPDNQYTIIILSNVDNGTTLLYEKIREALDFKGVIENF